LSTTIYGFANTLCFQFQIEDLHLKYRILGQNSKNKTSGRNLGEESCEPQIPGMIG
jgi:hypothetical protein